MQASPRQTTIRRSKGAIVILGAGIVLAGGFIALWLNAAKQTKTDPISYLRYPIKRVGTVQVGDRTTANLSELNFNDDGTFLLTAAEHYGNELEESNTLRVNKQLSINTLAVSDNSLLKDKITRISENQRRQSFVPTNKNTTLRTNNNLQRFITIGEAGNAQIPTVNLWARDTASNPDGSLPMLLVDTLTFKGQTLLQAEMSVDGMLFAIVSKNNKPSTLWLIDGFTGKIAQTLEVASPITAIAFSPDNKTLVTAYEDRSIYLRDATTGKEIREFTYTQLSPPRNQRETKIAFSDDGTLLAFGDTAGIHLWNIESGELLRTIELENAEGVNVWTGTNGLAISPDNQWIVSDAGHTNKMYIWQISTGEMQRILRPGHTPIQLAFSPDGKLLASGDNYGEVSVWQLPEQFKNAQP